MVFRDRSQGGAGADPGLFMRPLRGNNPGNLPWEQGQTGDVTSQRKISKIVIFATLPSGNPASLPRRGSIDRPGGSAGADPGLFHAAPSGQRMRFIVCESEVLPGGTQAGAWAPAVICDTPVWTTGPEAVSTRLSGFSAGYWRWTQRAGTVETVSARSPMVTDSGPNAPSSVAGCF